MCISICLEIMFEIASYVYICLSVELYTVLDARCSNSFCCIQSFGSFFGACFLFSILVFFSRFSSVVFSASSCSFFLGRTLKNCTNTRSHHPSHHLSLRSPLEAATPNSTKNTVKFLYFGPI